MAARIQYKRSSGEFGYGEVLLLVATHNCSRTRSVLLSSVGIAGGIKANASEAGTCNNLPRASSSFILIMKASVLLPQARETQRHYKLYRLRKWADEALEVRCVQNAEGARSLTLSYKKQGCLAVAMADTNI